MAVLGTLMSGCSGSWDLTKIFFRNIAYEISHPMQPPATKMKIPHRSNPGNPSGLYVGWVGHSTVLLSFHGSLILTDPSFTNRVTIARRVVSLPLEPEEIKDLDLILITHAHYDHLDLPSLKRLPKEATLIVPRGCQPLVDGLGLSKIIEMDWNDVFTTNGLRIEALRPAHWGRRNPWDEDRGYNSYILSKNGKSILLAGDTGYTKVFAEKGKGRMVALAFFPIGAYSPDWFRLNHATPEEALKMFMESGARFMVPIHWGTFILSHEPIEEPLLRMKQEAQRLGIEDRLIILRHGESFTLPE